MPGQVERWLETFMCKQYAETFEAYGFKTLQSLCQIQLQQLQIMGVAQEHCEQILDNVDILRQSLGGTSGVNHYQDSMYNAYGNRSSNIGPMHHNSSAVPMNSIHQNMTGYNSQSYLNNQTSMIQQQHQQTQYHGHNLMYSMSQYGSYLGYGGSVKPRQYQYSAVERRTDNNYTSDLGPQQKNQNGYHTRPQSQNVSNQQVPQTLMRPHLRHNSLNQNPQEVANNILQMAACTYMPNQTVTVPLSKNRSAPYHIPPKSPHNSYSMQGNCPTTTSQQQHIGQAHQFAYPNSSPHQASQRPCASPMSPNPVYLHSPTTSHHSGQSMPNSSPQSIHSPNYGMSGPCVKSPCSVAPSPGGEVCSPCQMTSPISCQVNAPNASPHHQQLFVNVPSGNISMYQGQIASPNHQNTLNQYSPKTNPVTPPASHNVSPYSISSRSSLHSPQHKSSMPLSIISGKLFSDSASDIPESTLSPQEKSTPNPLQSLRKLCMLPDHQVIDPKSVVSDACLESTQSNERPKNLNSDVDNHSQNQDQCSASNTKSPEYCDNISDVETNIDKTSNVIHSHTLSISNNLSQLSHESCSLDSTKRELSHVESQDLSMIKFSVSNVESDKSENESKMETNHHIDVHQCNKSQQLEVEQQTDQALQGEEIQGYFENQGHNGTLGDEKVQQDDMTKEILVKDKENLLSSDTEDVTLNVKEICESGILAYPNCGLAQCKTLINPETDGCEQVICKSVGCKENDDILSEIIDYENVAKENNNEITPQLNGDKNSCTIQYYRPKCIKKTKRKKMLNFNASFRLNSNMISKVRENPLLVKTYSRRDQLAAKYRWRRSQMPRSVSLKGVPARLASAAQYSSANYTDSDSDDGGVLLVREDIDFTWDQGSPLLLDSVSDEVSVGDVSCVNDTEKDDSSLVEDLSSRSFGVEGEESLQSVENINIYELALDTTKNSQTLAVDGAKNQAKVHSKSGQCAKKNDKSNLVEGMSRNSNTQNGHIQSEQKSRKFEKTSISSRITKGKNHSSAGDLKKDSDEDEEKVTRNKRSANKTPSRTPAKRSSRKRRRASSLKYGDLYYSADYVLDSEEEIEIEMKSKINRGENNASTTKDSEKNDEDEVIIVNDDDDDDDDDDDNKSKMIKDVTVSSVVESSKRTKLKTNSKITKEDVSVEDLSGTVIRNSHSELKQQKISYIAKLVNEDGEPISISDDDVGKEMKEKQKKSIVKDKKKLKPENVKSGNKSGKGRLKKLQKSHAKFELFDDETEEINLRKTISIMNKKHKKPEKVKVDENKSRINGPYLRVRTTEPCYCHVVNQYEEGTDMSDQKITKKVSTPITVSTVHMSKLSAEKSIHVPSHSLTETNWMCQLCHKHSSFKFLGDLFGPYFCEGNIPSSSPQDTLNSDLKKHKQKIVTNLDVGDLQQKTKKRTNLTDLSRPPEEVWVHEDCIAWADGVLLIGQKIYGLEEATAIASTTMCSVCKGNGAMVGCLHKGCSQKFHYICAVESGCFMDEENFSLLCNKHKDKKIKQIETSSIS